jgi:hypothetical protein
MRRTIVTLALLALIASPAAAGLWDSDSFDAWTNGTPLPDTSKWTGAESYKTSNTSHDDYTAVSGDLANAVGLPAGTGMVNCPSMSSSQGASTESNATGITLGAVYVSFVLDVNDASTSTWSKSSCLRMDSHDYDAGGNVSTNRWENSLFGIVGNGSGGYTLTINKGSGNGGDSSALYYDHTGPGATGAQFVVWKTEIFSDGTSAVSAWIDPSLTSLEGTPDLSVTGVTGTDKIKGMSFIEYGPVADFDMDYWRIGDSWSAVVPEPATMALLGLGGLAAVIRRRR